VKFDRVAGLGAGTGTNKGFTSFNIEEVMDTVIIIPAKYAVLVTFALTLALDVAHPTFFVFHHFCTVLPIQGPKYQL
jgi:hypothetical protein